MAPDALRSLMSTNVFSVAMRLLLWFDVSLVKLRSSSLACRTLCYGNLTRFRRIFVMVHFQELCFLVQHY